MALKYTTVNACEKFNLKFVINLRASISFTLFSLILFPSAFFVRRISMLLPLPSTI
jgi:hypothetical protein